MPVVTTKAESRHGATAPATTPGARRDSIWIIPILALAFALRFAGLQWGQAYGYFSQGDGVEAYSVAVNYGHGEDRARYLAQPNYNEKSKLPGPLWTIFCFLSLRFGGGIVGVNLALILLNTAAVYLIYKLSERAFGSPASLWAALLAATSPWAVYYSVAVYNPNIMAFLGGLLYLALWETISRPGSRQIFWVFLLLLILPQFHMSGLLIIPAVFVILLLSGQALNVPWLFAGIFSGALCYLPYVIGDLNHGWKNTLGMVSGKDRYSLEGLKALSAPLSFLISWAPRWTRTTAEFHELGAGCFGSFTVFMVFNVLSMIAAGFIIVGIFLKLRTVLKGVSVSPRKLFNQNPGFWFPALLLGIPLLVALVGGRAFHTRYCILFLPPLFALAGGAAAHWQQHVKLRSFALTVIIATMAGNIWFVPAMYHHQGSVIEKGPTFVPSFRQMETVYQRLKSDAGAGRKVQVSAQSYLDSLGKGAVVQRDAILLHRYVAIREKDSTEETTPAQVAEYTLSLKTAGSVTNGNPVYDAHGIVLTRSSDRPADGQ